MTATATASSAPSRVGQLYRAALRGDAALVSNLLASAECRISAVEEKVTGRTPVFAAAFAGHAPVVRLLSACGSDVNAREGEGSGSHEGWTPLMAAAVEGHVEVISELLEAGAEVDLPCGAERQTPLQAAAEEGHVAAARALLQGGASVDAADGEGTTALLTAAWLGHHEVVEELISAGANVNTSSSDGRSPLFAAAQEGHEAVVRSLLAAGAQVNYARTQGETALYIAAHKGEMGCVEALLNAGADATIQDLEGDTPVSLAAKEGHEDLIALLVRRSPAQLSHVHFATTCSHEQKATIFRSADAEIEALRSQLAKQAEAMEVLQAAHRKEMAQIMAGLPHLLSCATSGMQRQRDAALREAYALRAESDTLQEKTDAMSSV